MLSIGLFGSLSFAAGGSVSIEIPTQSFQQNGLNLSSVAARLESRSYSRSLALEFSNSELFGTIEDVPEGKYTLHLEFQYKFGDHRNPVTTSHTALSFYDRYLDTNDLEARQGFINNAEWLLANHNADYYFPYDFDLRHSPAPLMKKGWVSAMAQGQALGVISIAYHLPARRITLRQREEFSLRCIQTVTLYGA